MPETDRPVPGTPRARRYCTTCVTELVYKVVLHPSEQGVAVQCPALPGCWSQGKDEAEALDNIEDAIREYLAAIEARRTDGSVREVRIAI